MSDSKGSWFWISLALILYLFLSLTYLALPGLQYDEVNFVNAALGRENAQFIAWDATIFGKRFPLMIMNYIGALKSGIYAPVFKLFGTSATTVRLPVVFIGLITLLVGFALFRRMFGRRTAIAGLFLFATDPTFIFANRLDWGPVALMLLLQMGSLYFMWRWMKEDQRCYVGIAGFLFGLGLYNKIIFAWYLVAFFIALSLSFRDRFKQLLRWRQLICFLPAFLLGCLPLIAFNIDIPMRTFENKPLLTSFGKDTLRNRYEQFRGTLDGGALYYLFNQAEVAYHPLEVPNSGASGRRDFAIGAVASIPWIGRSPMPLALAGSFVFILITGVFKHLGNRREILFMGTQLLVIAVFICLTAEATGAHHVIALYPFVFAVIAFAFCELGNWLGKSRMWASGFLLSACLLPLLLTQLVIDARYLHSFRTKGGVGFWSDAIYELASFARENRDKFLVVMDWGFGNQLSLLSNNQIRYEEFVCDAGKDLERCLEPLTARAKILLVFHAPPFGDQVVLNAYRNCVEKKHLHAQINKAFFQRDGRPVYLVYETVQPMLEAQEKDFLYKREAEDFDAKSGGDIDFKSGASHGKALGNYWGRQRHDFASYSFTLPDAVSDTRLYLRYAFVDPGEQQYHLFLDGHYFITITLPSSHGFGYTAEEWTIFETELGYLSRGTHELRIIPARSNQVINLDYFLIRNSKFGITH
jgi:4-amino-4-deoxy-L-arabinose transferase-like glycosyltransferase